MELKIIKQEPKYHLYVDDKDMWLDHEEMKQLFTSLARILGASRALIRGGKVYAFGDDEEGVDECSRCILFHECKEGSLCTDCFKENLIGKRFKLL